MSVHSGVAYRAGSWWVVEVDGVGVTQAASRDEVEHMARDLVSTMLDTPYEDVQVDVSFRVDDGLTGH